LGIELLEVSELAVTKVVNSVEQKIIGIKKDFINTSY
jgi:hypothetical protein